MAHNSETVTTGLNVFVEYVPICTIENGEGERERDAREFVDVNRAPQPDLCRRVADLLCGPRRSRRDRVGEIENVRLTAAALVQVRMGRVGGVVLLLAASGLAAAVLQRFFSGTVRESFR